MYTNSNLIISARDGEQLIGIARSLTDFSFCCYLSDLAVKKDYQRSGIGKELINRTRNIIGDECMLLLLSAPAAMEYYPKIGMDNIQNAFLFNRKR
jgi:ribosomal protein S18 acetylase RimI-like enzyme